MDKMTSQRQGKSHHHIEQFERMIDYSNIDVKSDLLKDFKINCLHRPSIELAIP